MASRRAADQNWPRRRSLNVCFWHKADITVVLIHVRFWG